MMLLIIICLHLFILSKLIFFPYPELFIYSYLTKIGLIPYKQIFDQHFPGVMFFPINLATLGIDTPNEARILHLGIVAITHLILFKISKKLFKSSLILYFPNLLYLLWQPFFEGYILWIDSFAVPLLLLGFYFLIDIKKKKHLFYSGLFLGMSLLFKQVVAPLIFFLWTYQFYLLKSFKKTMPYLLGLTIPVSVLIIWITALHVWREFFYWTVTFNLTTFSQMGRKYPDLNGLVKTLPIIGIGIISLIFGYTRKLKYTTLITIFLIGSLAFAYARFDFVHLQPTLAFSIIATTFLVRKLSTYTLKVWLFSYFLISLILLIPFYKNNWGKRTLFFGEFEKNISEKVLKYADSGETIFALGTTPHVYYLTKTRPPGNVFVFQFPWFMQVAEQKILQGILADPPKVVIRDKNAKVGGLNLIEFMPNIGKYIENYYKVIDHVGGTEIMIRI